MLNNILKKNLDTKTSNVLNQPVHRVRGYGQNKMSMNRSSGDRFHIAIAKSTINLKQEVSMYQIVF